MTEMTFHAPFPVDRTVTSDGIQVLTGAGFAAIVAERMKQVDGYGRTLAHDQGNDLLDLALAGISYANTASDQLAGIPVSTHYPEPTYPWAPETWRPENSARANLVKAAALIWAAIDYLDTVPAGASVAVDLDRAA
jgi:hypothetical protein